MNRLKSESGFTYIAAIVLVTIMGIMLAAVGETTSIVMKREREAELMFRGTQYVRAIERWQNSGRAPGAMQQPTGPGAQQAAPVRQLTSLEDLAKPDTRFAGKVQYLRQLYLDPMTNKEFEPIKDPAKGIIGVKSTSHDEPLKQANFPLEFLEFEGKKKYSEWEFIFDVNRKNRTAKDRDKGGRVTGPDGKESPFSDINGKPTPPAQ